MPVPTWRSWRCVLAVFLAIAACCPRAAWSQDSAPRFTRDIAPLLTRHCLACHGGSEPKGELEITTREGILRGGRQGAAVQPGEADDSLMWQYVSAGEMPPEKPLEAGEIELLRQWIDAGAAWEGGGLDFFAETTSDRAGRDWWSLQPLQAARPPDASADWPAARNAIDLFLAQRLAEQQLAPSVDAPPRDQVRRLYFDLIGLPPDPETVRRFEADPTDEHYQRLVDRLLADPGYGERWARHWLDVARYGESDGFERNHPRDNFWQYRDWVIDALNRDLRYDEFVRWQIAGDILGQDDPSGLAATGFLVAGVHNTVIGSSESMRKLAREDELEEITAAVAQTFLGLTLNCARCHDHKYDPLTQQDYYSFTAALAGVFHGQRSPRRPELIVEVEREAASTQDLLARIDQLQRVVRQRLLAERGDSQRRVVEEPRAYARWEFEGDLQDVEGRLPAELVGAARIEDGALVLDGQSHAKTSPLPSDIREKTLEAWVLLDDVEQRGGAAISLQSDNGAIFDAIVWGENEPGRWMAGSELFHRTKSFGASVDDSGVDLPVHVAIVYAADGAISAYRNGKSYGEPYQSAVPVTFAAEKSVVLFGLRHEPPGGNRFLKARILRAGLYDRALSASEISDCYATTVGQPTSAEIQQALDPQELQLHQRWTEELRGARQRLKTLKEQQQRKIYTVAPEQPPTRRLLARGSITAEREVVSPAAIAAIPKCSGDFGLQPDAPEAERRLRLVDWLTHGDNPLWTRVVVNRLWHHHFGAGLVETPNDLGFNGGQPSHPELLDWLASYLKSHRYQLKPLHRLMVTSSAYRQSSAWRRDAASLDRGNRWLWRASPVRLDGEVLRDAMLQVSGQLYDHRFGPGFRDVVVNFNNGSNYYEPFDSDEPELNRRTVYRFTPRGGRSGLLDAFDCPDPSTAAPRRATTTTPLQALSLLNNALVIRLSRSMQARLQEEVGSEPTEQVRRAFWLTLGREPDVFELQQAEVLVRRHGAAALARLLFNANEFVVAQ